MRQRTVPSLLAATLAVGLTGTAVAKDKRDADRPRPAAYTFPAEATTVFPEGIAREPGSKTFFVTSTTDGSVWRGDLRSPQLTPFDLGNEIRETAIGLKADKRGNLVVAGGGTGKIFVLSTEDPDAPETVRDTGLRGRENTFLNDVAVSDGYAYVTDSVAPKLYRVRLGRDGRVGPLETFRDFTGTAFAYQPGFNANGIAIDEAGRYAIIVQSGTGKLFRVDLKTKDVSEVKLTGGEPLTNGDGILLKGDVLYVSRNAAERIVPVRLSDGGRRGEVGAGVTGPQLKYPTTIALDGKRILAVNSQFDKRNAGQPAELPFDVATIDAPKAPKGGEDDRRGDRGRDDDRRERDGRDRADDDREREDD